MPRNFKAFFISDLHLSDNTPVVTRLFNHFISKIIKPGDTLFILGDFFEYYLGKDLLDNTQLHALNQLKKLQECGSKIYFMHGNRDFLIYRETLKPFGINLLKDPELIEYCNKKVLLTHGDILCTDDTAYQRYRKLAHNNLIQWLFLHLPKNLRTLLAKKIHAQNPHGEKIKNPHYTLADANPHAIEQIIQRSQPDFLIYGHVHKMGTYSHGQTTRMVLGDWYHTGNYIQLNENEIFSQIFTSD